MPPQDILAVCVAAGFVFIYGRIWLRRHREAPLRRELRTRDVTFQAVLARVKVSDSGGWPKWVEVSAPMGLFLRGDAIEVSSSVAVLRVVMGLEYYLPAAGTSVELSRWPSRVYRKDWIVLTGQQAGREIQVAITTANDHMLLQAWNALVTAGAIPAGLPPQVPG